MPEGPPPPPVVSRVRLRFAKRGRLRFSSHRDFQRAFERALRRAGVPMAYSAGFNPHPRISFANAAPTGAASEAEYLEIGLAEQVDLELLRQALDRALPPGLDILEAVQATPGALADRLEASLWRIELPQLEPDQATAAVTAFLAADEVPVTRMMKTGPRTFDARGAVIQLTVETAGVASGDRPTPPGEEFVTHGGAQGAVGHCAILHLVVRHTTPAVRPDDVLTGLRSHAQLTPPSSPRMTRLAQGPWDEVTGMVADPLAADREVVGA